MTYCRKRLAIALKLLSSIGAKLELDMAVLHTVCFWIAWQARKFDSFDGLCNNFDAASTLLRRRQTADKAALKTIVRLEHNLETIPYVLRLLAAALRSPEVDELAP